MANTFREVYKKTGASSYQLVGNVGVGGIKLDIMKGATSNDDGEIGLVPKPSTGQEDYILTGAGSWQNISKYLGTSSISGIGDGTVKGAIKHLYETSYSTKTFTKNVSLASRGAQTVNFDITFSDWYDIGIIEIDHTDKGGYLHISKYSTQSGIGYVTIQNTYSSTLTFDLTIRVLYIKNV